MANLQNTLIMWPPTINQSIAIRPSLLEELVYGSEMTGASVSYLVNEALDWYCGGDLLALIESAKAHGKKAAKKA